MPFTEMYYETAVSAYLKFGKGQHAAAKFAGVLLLFVGDDFPKTDLLLA